MLATVGPVVQGLGGNENLDLLEADEVDSKTGDHVSLHSQSHQTAQRPGNSS